MEYLRLLLLIAGIVTLASSAKVKEADAQGEDYPAYNDGNTDYPGDDDYGYDDEVPPEEEHPPVTNEIQQNKPAYFERDHLNITAFVGGDVILPCDLKDAKSSNVFLWSNGSNVLTTHRAVVTQRSRISLYSNFSLKIANVDEYDAKMYTCAVLPEKVNLTITLNVVKSQIAIRSNGQDVTNGEITVKEGDRVEFECFGPSGENVDIKWSKKGQRIENGANGVRLQGGSIIIENINHHSHGLFQCIADGGQENPPHATLTLNIKYKPNVAIKRHYVNALIGEEAELYCNYHANAGEVSIFWAKEGTALRNERRKYRIQNNENMKLYETNHTVLFVNKVDASDYGQYECIVKNELGQGSGNIYLIQEPEPAHFENITIDGTRVTIQWLARSKQIISEAILDYRKNEVDRWMTEMVPKPQHHTSGVWKIQHSVQMTPGTWHARIKTRNAAGWSRFSSDHTFEIPDVEEPVEMEEKPSPPTGKVLTASIGGGNSAIRQSLVSMYLVITLLLPYFLIY